MFKKLIIVLFVIVALLVAGFFCIGIIVPSVDYETTIVINKPRDFTWQVMRERKDWIYGFKSFEQLSGTPNEVGSRARVTVVRDGRETTFDTELVDIRPPESSATRFTNDTLTHNAAVRLSEADGKTTIVSDEKLEGKNPFWRSIFVIFKGRIVETSRKNFEGLKNTVESTQ
ncbi:MAG TPA: SRPBCC family protein [Pyrinomonadaceae bacterium]|nr:SRPBCC family protein [Pyrinomonadaceae bacterium]